MRAGIEGRLAKLEASDEVRKPEFILAETEPGETDEAFKRRVDRLIRESTERYGVEPIVLAIAFNHR